MGNRNPFTGFLAILGIAVFLIVLWPPLLLAVLAAGGYFWFRVRSLRKQMEKELDDRQSGMFYQRTDRKEPAYQDDLFQEQVSRLRDENAEVIDVEFTRKDSSEEEKQSI